MLTQFNVRNIQIVAQEQREWWRKWEW